MADTNKGLQLGRRIAPPRFIAFIVIAIVGGFVGVSFHGWAQGLMLAFDLAATIFLLSLWPLMKSEAEGMRQAAERNDANRAVLLGVTGVVMLTVLVAVFAEVSQKNKPEPGEIGLIVVTLALAWLFSNTIYALHYAYLFYSTKPEDGEGDCGGLDFAGDEKEPDYWDFIYFAWTLGMTFQTSDTSLSGRHMRRVATWHCLAAFVFNIGVLAFTINVLGGG